MVINHKTLSVDEHSYDCEIHQNITPKNYEVPRIVLVSYQPNEALRELVECAIQSLLFYSGDQVELWIVDNFTGTNNSKWLTKYNDQLNIIFLKNHPKEKCGSYANALGIEAFLEYYNQIDFNFLGSLHQDICVTRFDWLDVILEKFADGFAAVGTRCDTGRVKEGVLHPLGCFYNYELIKKHELSFWPNLPNFDFADLVSVNLRKLGYRIFYFDNTIWDERAKNALNASRSKFMDISVDRSLNDKKFVFFMHLGRGVVKTSSGVNDNTIEWCKFLKVNCLPVESDDLELEKKLKIDISYSMRRFFVDGFGFKFVKTIDRNEKILDVGGKKTKKRGVFNLEHFSNNVDYLNIDSSTSPDFCADASNIPVEDCTYDGVICMETIEHLRQPEAVFKEVHRVLKSNGTFALTAPFLFHLHSDPSDYGRYTSDWYIDRLSSSGFRVVSLKKQGNFAHYLIYLCKTFTVALVEHNKILQKGVFNKVILYLLKIFIKLLLKYQDSQFFNHRLLIGFTLGFEVFAVKERNS